MSSLGKDLKGRAQIAQPALDPLVNPDTKESLTSSSEQVLQQLRDAEQRRHHAASVGPRSSSGHHGTNPALDRGGGRGSGVRELRKLRSQSGPVGSQMQTQTQDEAVSDGVQEVLRELEMSSEQALRVIAVDEAKVQRHLLHYRSDQETLALFKSDEQDLRAQEQSRHIERKRRLLTESEAKAPAQITSGASNNSNGHVMTKQSSNLSINSLNQQKHTNNKPAAVSSSATEKANVYDFYAVRIQSAIRGWLARCWVAWFRSVLTKAGVLIQSLVRGGLARHKVRRLRLRYRCAVLIQKTFRGWSTRGVSAAMAQSQSLIKMAVVLQRVWRGVLGRKRAKNKFKLDCAAKQAFEAVDATALVASDVKELGRRITYALDEAATTSLPPDEVLDLIRLAVMVVQAGRGPLGVSSFDALQRRHYSELKSATDQQDESAGRSNKSSAEDDLKTDDANASSATEKRRPDELSPQETVLLTWRQAAQILNRSERFIRLVRTVAYGSGAKPPRLVQLPESGNALYAAQQSNALWKLSTFAQMGPGSRICTQLFQWLSSMMEVATRQQEFLALIASAFPDWLPQLQDKQKVARQCALELSYMQTAYKMLDESLELKEGDEGFGEDEDEDQAGEGGGGGKEEGEDEDEEKNDRASKASAHTMKKTRKRRKKGDIAELTDRENKLLRRAMNEAKAKLKYVHRKCCSRVLLFVSLLSSCIRFSLFMVSLMMRLRSLSFVS